MRPKKSQGRNTHTKGNGLHTSNTSHDTTSLEMTTQRKRDLLASVGFLEQDEELPQVHLTGSFRSNSSQISNHPRFHTDEKEEWYHEKEERRRHKQQMKEVHPVDFDEIEFDYGDDRSSNEYSCGETEDEELLENALEDDYDDDSQCSEREVSSRGGLCCRVTTKLIYIMALVAAFLYIFGDDSTTATVHDDSGLEVQPHEYFSYKGYKDGRIPDDDLAQYGVGLLFQGDDHGVTDDETFVEDGIDVENNLDSNINDINSKESFSKHSTGVPNEDSLWHDLAGYTDLSTPYNPEAGDIAFFWHIPKCGGTTLQDLMMHCIGMVGANEVGGTYASDESLQIIQVENGNRYVNVDVTQPDGIIHAQNMGFVSSGLADVVMSTRFHNVASLFAPRQQDSKIAQGRCFTLLRHPVKRAISMFYYLRDATWEHTYSEIYKSMTIEDYAVSQYTEDNWMGEFDSSVLVVFATSRPLLLNNFYQ